MLKINPTELTDDELYIEICDIFDEVPKDEFLKLLTDMRLGDVDSEKIDPKSILKRFSKMIKNSNNIHLLKEYGYFVDADFTDTIALFINNDYSYPVSLIYDTENNEYVVDDCIEWENKWYESLKKETVRLCDVYDALLINNGFILQDMNLSNLNENLIIESNLKQKIDYNRETDEGRFTIEVKITVTCNDRYP